ncbi:NAD(P)-dependent oxidoreductase [Oxalobacteraceae bacterium CAVE-383]|nr:NAD(P)-dependent oxidoreductase [Oxalobacteraceae bacterium CAVE-383]
MSLFVLTGATGFIGRHMLDTLLAEGHSVRALTRSKEAVDTTHPNLTWISGDAEDPQIWQQLAVPGAIVINLGYSNSTPQSTAVAATAGMIEICAQKNIARFIHCSTASVYGRNTDAIITEQSDCLPITDYGRLKLDIELMFNGVQGRFPVVILRPTVVFGFGGEALMKLCNDLIRAPGIINYFRSSLYGFRHTHLVPVETVTAAIKFMATTSQCSQYEVLNVSDEYDCLNNFRMVEQMVMQELALKPYACKQLPIPQFLLEILLWFRHRSIVNTRSIYSAAALTQKGFVNTTTLEASIQRFVQNYKNSRHFV